MRTGIPNGIVDSPGRGTELTSRATLSQPQRDSRSVSVCRHCSDVTSLPVGPEYLALKDTEFCAGRHCWLARQRDQPGTADRVALPAGWHSPKGGTP